MRQYGIEGTWTDFRGRQWPLVRSRSKLKFKYPAHAALRAHVFHRDGFACVRCRSRAVDVPVNYDGAGALFCETYVRTRLGFRKYGRSRDVLVLDHRVTRRAGGLSVIENLQALCETCNRRKIPEDRRVFAAYQWGAVA